MSPVFLRHPSWIVRYGSTVLAVVLALVFSLLQPFESPSPFLFFFVAVSVSAWYGGLGPSVVAIVLSVLALDYFFVPPIYSLGVRVSQAMGFGVFVVLAVLINSLHAGQRRLERILAANEEQFRLAKRIQQKLFPNCQPPLDEFDIAGVCISAEATGGDYFDYFPLPDGSYGIAIGDVSSHGFGPALLMAEVHASLRALVLVQSDVGEILTLANRLVYEDTEDDQFITVFLGRLNPRTGFFNYASAGQRGYLLEGSGEVTKLECTGLPLGIKRDEVIGSSAPVALKEDAVVLLLTDGVLETCSPSGTPFGLVRVMEITQTHFNRSALDIAEALCQAVRDFGAGTPRHDDVTAVVIKRRLPVPPRPDSWRSEPVCCESPCNQVCRS